MDEPVRVNGERAAHQMLSSSSETSSGETAFTPVEQVNTTAPEPEPRSRREPRYPYVSSPPAPPQVNGPRRTAAATLPDVSAPTVNGIAPPYAPLALRRQHTSRSQGAAPQESNLINQAVRTIQERRFHDERRRRSNRSGPNQGTQLSPHAPAFVPLSIPTTQANQQVSQQATQQTSQPTSHQVSGNTGGAPVHPASADQAFYQNYPPGPYAQWAPPAHSYPTYLVQQQQAVSPLPNGLYPGPQRGATPPPASAPHTSRPHHQHPGRPTLPPPASLTAGLYQSRRHEFPRPPPPPPPGLGASLGSLFSGALPPPPPPPPTIPPPPGFGRAQVSQGREASEAYERAASRPPRRQLTEEEARAERIRIHRERDERARGFDEQDDDEFIPGL